MWVDRDSNEVLYDTGAYGTLPDAKGISLTEDGFLSVESPSTVTSDGDDGVLITYSP